MSRTMVSIGHTRIYFSLISRSNQYPFFFSILSKPIRNYTWTETCFFFFWYWWIYCYNYRKMWNMRYMQFQSISTTQCFDTEIIMKFIVPSYVRIYSLYIFLYVMLLLTLSVSVAGSCFLQWTQKILTINKKLSRYSLFVFYYFLDNLKNKQLSNRHCTIDAYGYFL